MAKHNDIGALGEDVATHWLLEHGFNIIERNHRRKWGEIDIIAKSSGVHPILHFIEVKTVSYETKRALDRYVSRETYQPEERVDSRKQARLSRVINTWIIENSYEGEWQIDVIVARVVPHEKYARVKLLEDIIFE